MMPIILKIISYQRLTPGQQDSFETKADKFTIGRNSENDWVLPDPQRFMSGIHCHIENRNGQWCITDTSTNGVFLNGSDQRMDKNGSEALHAGDRIRIGDYEFEVNMNGGSSTSPFDETSTGKAFGSAPDSTDELKDVNTPLAQMDRGLLGESVSIDDLFELDDEKESEEIAPPLADQGNQGPSLKQHFAAPKTDLPEPATPRQGYEFDLDSIPDNWDEETGLAVAPTVSPEEPPASKPGSDHPASGDTPMAPAEPAGKPSTNESARKTPAQPVRADSPLAAFAAGAGLDASQLPVADENAFFHELGALVETMTEGLRQAIASRGQVKSEFRLEQTMIAPTQNNPFKFSVTSQEALLRILSPSDKAYLSGPRAAAEALDDINAHQMAVLAGTEAALRSILRRFKPANLENKFTDQSWLSKTIPIIGKARSWDFYKALYDEVSEAADDDFQQMFGAEFSTAYEKQLDRLKIARKDSTK
jgi:type VI secretion system protein